MKRSLFVALNRAVNAVVRMLGLSKFRGGDQAGVRRRIAVVRLTPQAA